MAWLTLEVFVVSRTTYSRALTRQAYGTRNALCEPWKAIRATRGQERNGDDEQDLKCWTSPAIHSPKRKIKTLAIWIPYIKIMLRNVEIQNSELNDFYKGKVNEDK